MEIKGSEVTLTHSEAEWLLELSTKPTYNLADIGQKVLDARCAFASQYMPADQLPTIRVTEAIRDVAARLTLKDQIRNLYRVEGEHGFNSNGTENHIIALQLTPDEKAIVRRIAQVTHEFAIEDTTEFQQKKRLHESVADNAAAFFITSDSMDAGEALALNELLHDPQFIEGHMEARFTEALHEINVTSGIIAAIDTERSQ